MPQNSTSAATPDSTTVAAALTFGGIVLPPSAAVLGADNDKGIDERYVLAIGTDPGSVEALLSGSGFTKALQPGRKVFMSPVRGFDPNSGTDIASAQDRLPPEGERTRTVIREILVDRSDTTKSIVHLWLFST